MNSSTAKYNNHYYYLFNPWSRNIISNSKWPRLVATAGTCLTCAGLLFVWFAISNGTRTAPWFVASGILSGLGASIVITQCEIILSQYFKMKLKNVNTCIRVIVAVGFVVTPIVLGNYIMKEGLLSVIIWYQIIILQGLVVCLLIRKPPYLKGKVYKLVQGMSDEEVDIFAKNTTELQNARHSLNSDQASAVLEVTSVKSQNTIDTALSSPVVPQSTMTNGEIHFFNSEVSSVKQTLGENLIDIEVHATANGKPDWERFDDNTSETTASNAKIQRNLRKSFSSDTNNDLERIESFEDNFVPKPLFTDTHINNNNTYSFDNSDSTSEEPVVFMPIRNNQPNKIDIDMNFIKQPTFYKSLLQLITLKFSIFTFFALFPSHLYMRIPNLRVHPTAYMIGYLSIISIFFALILTLISANTYRRPLFLWIFSWTGALGYIIALLQICLTNCLSVVVISDVKNEVVLIIGAMMVIVSIQSLQYFGNPLLKLNARGESNRIHITLSVVSGLMFFVFYGIDMTYVNCFRLMALLQFVTGGIWFANFLFKKIKPIFTSTIV